MPLNPALAEVIQFGIDRALLELHTCTVGRVRSYDAATQRAHVLPLIRAVEYSDSSGRQSYELPVLPNVPVVWPRAGGYALHLPLQPGDDVLLVFAESDTSFWRADWAPAPGGFVDPPNLQRHSLSYAFALAGVFPDQAPIEDAPTDHAVLVVPPGGKLRVSPAGATGKPVALAEKVAAQLTALKEAIANATPVANDGGAALQTAILTALADWPGDVAAATLEAE